MTPRKSATLIFLASAACLSGCATPLPVGDKPRKAPANPHKATVYVFDDVGGIALGSGEIVLVNGTTVGLVSRRQFTWFYLSPGTMDISMNAPEMTSHKMSAQRFLVDAGKAYFVRYKIAHRSSDGALLAEIMSGVSRNAVYFHPDDLTLVPEAEAWDRMNTMKLVGSRNL